MKKTIIIIFLILFSFTGFCQIPPKQITDYRETSDYIEGKKSLVKGTLYYAAGLACETAGLFMLLSEPKSNTTTALGGEKVTVVNYSTNYIGGIVCVSGIILGIIGTSNLIDGGFLIRKAKIEYGISSGKLIIDL